MSIFYLLVKGSKILVVTWSFYKILTHNSGVNIKKIWLSTRKSINNPIKLKVEYDLEENFIK